MDFAAWLRALMDEAGLGVRALARKVPCDPGLISRLANGKDRPSRPMAALLDNVLGADGELIALADVARPPVTADRGAGPELVELGRSWRAGGSLWPSTGNCWSYPAGCRPCWRVPCGMPGTSLRPR